jgi:hypothetical protein
MATVLIDALGVLAALLRGGDAYRLSVQCVGPPPSRRQPFDVIDPIGTQRRSALSRRFGGVTGRVPGFPAVRPQGAQRFTQQLPLVLAQALNVFQPSLDLVEGNRA